MNDETLKEQIMEIVDITHSNCPYVKPCPVYNQSIRAIQEVLLQDRERAVREARIDELNRLIKLHTRTYTQTITDNMGEVYLSDGHSYISKYEAQERLAQLSNPTQEKGKL